MQAQVEKLTKPKNMSEELSGVTVVIIIGLGVLTFLLLFIFAKRQIMRFALRSRRGPHVPVGHDAPKVTSYNKFPSFIMKVSLFIGTEKKYRTEFRQNSKNNMWTTANK